MEEHVYQSPGKSVISQIFKTLHQYFPSLKTHLASLPDSRRRKQYSTQELAMAGVCMFMLKEGSRNAFNNDRKNPVFRANYQRVFGLDLPHLDTVDDYFRDLATSCLEEVKASLIRDLLRKKVLQPHKYRGCYIVAIDGTGVSTYSHKHCEYCLHKKSGSGVVTWSHNVLEAKFLTLTGLSLSIASEWISNEGRANYQKQDCEQAAFKRLVAHNIAFDEKIIGAEFIRNGMENSIPFKRKICTMKSTKDYCAINGPYGFKWPTLSELYYKLFGTYFDEAHNAAADIEATAECFWELRRRDLL